MFRRIVGSLLLVSCLAPAWADTPATALRRPALGDPAAASREKLPPKPVKPALPPLPEGVAELTFADFFKMPVGPEGLELTEKLRALHGQRVRIFGYMVKEDLRPCNSCVPPPANGKPGRRRPAWMEATVPGRMMFTAAPCGVSHSHYGLADDLPPQTVFVTVPDKFGELVPYTPGPMLLTGVLSVGNRDEPEGRISIVRLTLEKTPPTPGLSQAAVTP